MAYNLVHSGVAHIAIAAQLNRVERGTEVATYGRKLRIVAYEHKPATLATTHILDKVAEKVARANCCILAAATREHRCLIHNEYRTLLAVVVQRETRLVVGDCALTIDALMYGVCLVVRIAREHLCSTPRWSEENRLNTQLSQGCNKARDNRRFARSSVAIEQKYRARITLGKPLR